VPRDFEVEFAGGEAVSVERLDVAEEGVGPGPGARGDGTRRGEGARCLPSRQRDSVASIVDPLAERLLR
jgi:hypothetical protein